MGSVRRLAFLLLLVGCGSNHDIHDAAVAVDGMQDGGVDAPADAANAESELVISDGALTVTAVTLPATFPTKRSSERLFVYNASAVPSSAITASLTGPGATSFAIDAAGSTCGAVLAAHDGCWLRIAFSPLVAGTSTATLEIAGGQAPLQLPLTGPAPSPPATGITTDVATGDFGTLIKGDSAQIQIVVENVGTTAVTLGARSSTAPFAYLGDNCSAPLTPGGACTIDLAFTSASVGHFTGTLAIASSANSLAVPLEATNLRQITVSTFGDGSGTVTSLPSGISCPGTCSSGFPGGIPVVLTATPSGSSLFVDWEGICSGTGSCTIPSPDDGAARPRFVLATDNKIVITMAGTGTTFVGAGPMQQTCRADCTIYVPSGTPITLHGYSPSTFVGWSGDCVATTNDCSLGTVINDRAVTVTSNADTYEAATLLPALPVTGIAVTSSGDLIVGNASGVSRMSITGTVVWTTAIAGGVQGLVVDSTDEVIAVGTTSVVKLSATGLLVWTASVSAKVEEFANDPAIAVSPDGSVIAVLTTGGMRVLDGAGADRFEITGAPNPTSVAVASDSTIALAVTDTMLADVYQANRYLPDGTALTPFAPLPGDVNAQLAYDATNALCVYTFGHSSGTVSRTTSTGSLAFSHLEHLTLSTPLVSGVLATPTGEVVRVRAMRDEDFDQGMQLDAYSATGTALYAITKAPVPINSIYFGAVGVRRIATGATNRLVLAGTWLSSPWIEVLDLP